jgi:hypothetical protein
MIREIKEQTGQDFFLPGNNSPDSLKAESTMIAQNATKKTNVIGFAAQVLQVTKKLIIYHIIATETMMLVRYANTLHNGGEPVPDIKIPQITLSGMILCSLYQLLSRI